MTIMQVNIYGQKMQKLLWLTVLTRYNIIETMCRLKNQVEKLLRILFLENISYLFTKLPLFVNNFFPPLPKNFVQHFTLTR